MFESGIQELAETTAPPKSHMVGMNFGVARICITWDCQVQLFEGRSLVKANIKKITSLEGVLFAAPWGNCAKLGEAAFCHCHRYLRICSFCRGPWASTELIGPSAAEALPHADLDSERGVRTG